MFFIGELASFFHVSPGTIRHYEELGLLKPSYVDPDTKYRFYDFSQFEVLHTVRYLRSLAMGLEDIGSFLRDRNVPGILDLLEAQKVGITAKQRELRITKRKLENRIQSIRDALSGPIGEIQLKTIDKQRFLILERKINNADNDDLEIAVHELEKNQKDSLVFLGKVGVGISKEHLLKEKLDTYDSVFLILDQEDSFTGKVLSVPAQLCAVIRVKGAHKEAPSAYKKLLNFIAENNLEILDFSREITLIDWGFTSDQNLYVTEIQIPVSKKMNNSFTVESKVFEVLPNYCVGVIRASIPNKASGAKAVRELFRKELQQFFHQYQDVALRDTKNISAYRSALQKAGINPNKFMCSIEALSRRVQKDGGLPEIDPIVDLGNAISLKYLLAVGAHDLANAQERSIAVRFSEKGDLFRPMGTLTDEGVPEGELVYVSGHQVKTRRFIWRQSDDGKITDLTTEYLIPLDGFIGVNEEEVLKARDEFASLLSEWFGASVSTGFISKESNIFKF